MSAAELREGGAALVPAVIRLFDEAGESVGAGFLAAPDLVLTCAHVVSDALGVPREEPVAAGEEVHVGFPLADRPTGEVLLAKVEHWIPTRPDRTGDVAVLRLPAPVPGTRPLPLTDPGDAWEHQVAAVGFTGGEPDEEWFHGRLSGPTSEGWIQLLRSDGQVAPVKEGFSGTPVWDVTAGAVIGLVVAARRAQDTHQAFVLRTRTLLRELPALAPLLLPASPFRGLATFRQSDADVFFGRDDDIRDVTTALRGDCRTVVLCGPSGCGKSSLALAGVAARMQRDGHEVLVVDAGKIASPRTALATALYEAAQAGRYGRPRVDSVAEVEDRLADRGLDDTLYVLRGGTGGSLLVVLDQAEALLDRTAKEIDEAVDLLFPPGPPGSGTRVLVTLRADFMDAMLKHPRLGPVLQGGRMLPVTPMSREQLQEVVTRPLAQVPAVEYDPGLDRRILDDTGGEPGVLPLLGFVLQELWDRQEGGRLRTEAYDRMGGVAGALKLHAEQAWRECVAGQPEAEAAAPALLTGLVRVLPGSETPLRRRLTRQEAGEERWRLARAFAERRLLVLHGSENEPETAELAHEALIDAWPELWQRVQADVEFLAARAELGHDRERWERGGRSADLLPRALHLASLQERLGGREHELTAEERDFLALARQRQRARRNRVRVAWTAVGVAFALIVGLGTFLVYQARISEKREAEGRSRALASVSGEVSARNPGLGVLAAVAAYDVSPTAEARNALLGQYAAYKETAWALSGAEGKLRAVATSNDGRVTLVTTRTGRATLFVRGAGGRVLTKQLRLPLNAAIPLVSRDGRRIAYIGYDVLHWHEVRPTARTAEALVGLAHSVPGRGFAPVGRASNINRDPVGAAAFSPDADRVAMVSEDGRLWLWDLAERRAREVPIAVTDAQGVWFGPDGDTLVVLRGTLESGSKNTVSAVDLPTGVVRTLATGVDAFLDVGSLGVSGNGGVLVTCGRTEDVRNLYRAVRVTDGRELARYEADRDTSSCDGIAVDRTGDRFATRKKEGEWLFLDTRSGKAAVTVGATDGTVAGMPLLGEGADSVVISWGMALVVGRPLNTHVLDIAGQPVLLGDGDSMLVREGEQGERLALVDVRNLLTGRVGGPKILVAKDRGATAEPGVDAMATNRAETFVADQVAPNRLTVRALPSLDETTEITTAMPPLDENGKRMALTAQFIDEDEFLTVSGSLVEQWNARDGRRAGPTINLSELELTDDPSPEYYVWAHRQPGYLQVTVSGDATLHAVSRSTGEENKELRVQFGDDYLTSVFTRDGRYAAVLTRGSLWEGWSVPTRGRPTRVFGPYGPMEGDDGRIQLVGSSQLVLAIGNSVRFVHFTDPDRIDSYNFGAEQYFVEVSRDGKTLLRLLDGGRMDLVRLDPALWKRHLCRVLGRDLTVDERRGLPSGLPGAVCPG